MQNQCHAGSACQHDIGSAPGLFRFLSLTRHNDLADTTGNAWLLENNCPPCCETASGLPFAEQFHDDVARELFARFVLPPLGHDQPATVFDPKWTEAGLPAAGYTEWEEICPAREDFEVCGQPPNKRLQCVPSPLPQ